MRYFFKIYGIWADHLSIDPIHYERDFHYLVIDKICAISGNHVTMANGDYYYLDDYNMNKLMEFLYHHESRFVDTLGSEWRPCTPMSTDR